MASIVYTFLVGTAILAVGGLGTAALAFLSGWSTLGGYRTSDAAFVALFFFRYWRFAVHLVAYLLYRPRPPSPNPRYRPADCTVIVPTVDPGTAIFRQCIASIAACGPAGILVVTIHEFKALAETTLGPVRHEFPDVDLQIHAHSEPNKRGQIAHVVGQIKTPVTILADSTVNWKHQKFLRHILAPFDDDSVALVGTNKRVVRESHDISTFQGLRASFYNFLGCIYLERHNFEIAASACVDSGVFVVSTRTCAVLTEVLQDHDFLQRYLYEHIWFLGCWKVGPLVADDDNFITRWCVAHGYGVRIQYAPEAVVETVLGEYPRFHGQCLRWARTTFRSNARSLLTARQYLDYPWSSYGVQLAGLTNFAFLVDGLLLNLNPGRTGPLALWILATKLVKLVPHFRRHPRDLAFFPAYIVWAYYHGLAIKLRALLTFANTDWTGRNLDFGGADAKAEPSVPNSPLPAYETLVPLEESDLDTPLVRRKGHGEDVTEDNN